MADKVKLVRLLIVLSIFAVLAIPFMGTVSASTSSYPIYSYYDSYLRMFDDNYTIANLSTSADISNSTGTSLKVGQDNKTDGYYLYRSVLQFDTQLLETATSINSASIFIWCKSNASSTVDDIVVVETSEMTTPAVKADFGYFLGKEYVGYLDPGVGLSTSDYTEIPLTDNGVASIVRMGVTKFGLLSTSDFYSVAAIGLESYEFFSSEGEHPPYLEIDYTETDLSLPNTVSIDSKSVKVFNNFSGVGVNDQLYVFSYKVIYNSGDPAENPGDYFSLRLYDGVTLKAQVPLPAWGYRPGSIYLSEANALPQNGAYSVEVWPVPGKFTFSIPYGVTIGIGPDTWAGSIAEGGSDPFKSWVLGQTWQYGKYYGAGDINTYLTKIGNENKINSEGGSIWLTGIDKMDSARPDLFESSQKDYSWDDKGVYDPTLKNKLLNNMGAQLLTAFDNIGQSFNLSGTMINSVFWGFLTIGVMVIGVSTGLSVAGFAIAIPAFMLGLFMGIPPILGAIVGMALFLLLSRHLWGARG